MEKPTIPYAWAFMHFSLTIIRYPRIAFDFLLIIDWLFCSHTAGIFKT